MSTELRAAGVSVRETGDTLACWQQEGAHQVAQDGRDRVPNGRRHIPIRMTRRVDQRSRHWLPGLHQRKGTWGTTLGIVW